MARKKQKVVLINFEADEPTREVFHRAAEADGISLSGWLRRLAVERAWEIERSRMREGARRATAA